MPPKRSTTFHVAENMAQDRSNSLSSFIVLGTSELPAAMFADAAATVCMAARFTFEPLV
jgi:hypothetical protein